MCQAVVDIEPPDPMFARPYVDQDEWRDNPVRHRFVHGGFESTDTRFSYYLPPMGQYKGRFFQYITPMPENEFLCQGASGEEDKIGFAIGSGAYLIETNGGGTGAIVAPGPQADPTGGAFRAHAAAARFSRVVAQAMYGGGRPFGYCFGGSGGAFRTIGGMENTEGVWDGAVPYVVGSPMAIPNVFTVRMHAMRVLKHAFPKIVDALEPGGSGDPYSGLNDEERQALLEVTRMGYPLHSWFGYRTMGIQAFPVLYPSIVMADPQYFSDFWQVPGYLGADSPASINPERVLYHGTVKSVITTRIAHERGLDAAWLSVQGRNIAAAIWQKLDEHSKDLPMAFQLTDRLPVTDFLGGDLVIITGGAAGQTLPLKALDGDYVVLGQANPLLAALVKPGDEVQIGNAKFLAAQTYHRHQVPSRDYYVWDQFRGSDGQPIYPQRSQLLGPLFAMGASGTIQSGRFKGKIIMLEALWDREAFPWQADWYRSKVKDYLGDDMDDHFELWYVDHALHEDWSYQEHPTQTVSYLGALQQALRDLSTWVEKGIHPPDSTAYRIVDGQVEVPPSASERKGIQPVVVLRANGGEKAVVRAGERVILEGSIELPPGTGRVVCAEFAFAESEGYTVQATLETLNTAGTAVQVKAAHTYQAPGTYYAALRAVTQREGDVLTPYARVQNLARVRVVVT
jgi:hypothetical protein